MDYDLNVRFGTKDESLPNWHKDIFLDSENLAKLFIDVVPESRELSLALTKLEEALFWANAAIMRHQETKYWVGQECPLCKGIGTIGTQTGEQEDCHLCDGTGGLGEESIKLLLREKP